MYIPVDKIFSRIDTRCERSFCSNPHPQQSQGKGSSYISISVGNSLHISHLSYLSLLYLHIIHVLISFKVVNPTLFFSRQKFHNGRQSPIIFFCLRNRLPTCHWLRDQAMHMSLTHVFIEFKVVNPTLFLLKKAFSQWKARFESFCLCLRNRQHT